MKRRAARAYAMKVLYEYSITGELPEIISSEENEDEIYGNVIDRAGIDYVNVIFEHFPENQSELDEIVSRNSHSWSLERISKVDLAIIRLALLEMKYTSIPPKVSINEAIELAKEYSSEKSFRFVNGILGGVLKNETNDV